jgi:hypothetical protein
MNRPMLSRKGAPSAPQGPHEAVPGLPQVRGVPALNEAAGAPLHGINGVGRREVPRPAVAALRMTSGWSNFGIEPSPIRKTIVSTKAQG